MTADKEPNPALDWSKWLPFLVAVVFGAGGAIASHQQLAGQVDKLEQRLREHVSAPAHAQSATEVTVLRARVNALEEGRRGFEGDIKDIRRSQLTMLRRLDALCAALGKRCTTTED